MACVRSVEASGGREEILASEDGLLDHDHLFGFLLEVGFV